MHDASLLDGDTDDGDEEDADEPTAVAGPSEGQLASRLRRRSSRRRRLSKEHEETLGLKERILRHQERLLNEDDPQGADDANLRDGTETRNRSGLACFVVLLMERSEEALGIKTCW